MVKMRVIFGYFWLIFGPKSHRVACSGACTLVLCFGRAMGLAGISPKHFFIFLKILSFRRSFLAIFGHFWTLSAKVVTRGAPWVPRHEDPTFLLCLKPLIPYNQGIWAKNAIFEMCHQYGFARPCF